jgi:hypothetical protein
MDILSVGMTVFGAFGAGVTVGALAFSPRLVTWSDSSGRPGHRDPAPVVYVIPGDPGSPVGPGYAPGHHLGCPPGMIPVIPAPPSGFDAANREQIPGRLRGNDRDSDPGQGLPSIMPPGTSPADPGTTSERGEGDR